MWAALPTILNVLWAALRIIGVAWIGFEFFKAGGGQATGQAAANVAKTAAGATGAAANVAQTDFGGIAVLGIFAVLMTMIASRRR